MSELPTGWIEVPIGMVCEVVGGSTPRTTVDDYWDGDIPWLTPDDLSRDRSQYVAAGRRCLTEAGYSSCSTQLIPAGSVLYTSRAPIGYVTIAKQAVCTNQGFKSFVPPPGLSSRYLYWYLQWATPMIRNLGSGTTFAEISGKVAKTIPLRLPPTTEQERIVAAIEEQVSRLDEAVYALQSARHRVVLLRRSILTEAALSDYPRKTVGDIANLSDGPFGSNMKTSDYVEEGPRVVRLQNIGDGYFRDEKACITEEHFKALTKHGVRPSDVVVASLGADAPRACLIPSWLGPAIVKADCIRVRANADMDPRFLMWILNSPPVRAQATIRIKGIGRPRLGLGGIRDLEVPVPPLDEQRWFVSKIEQGTTLLAALDDSVGRALGRVDQLRGAILQRAFVGKLVRQDPNDEPAPELLARIASHHRNSIKPRRRQRA